MKSFVQQMHDLWWQLDQIHIPQLGPGLWPTVYRIVEEPIIVTSFMPVMHRSLDEEMIR